MAHKFARLVYRLSKHGQDYSDKGLEYYNQRYREQQITLPQKQALSLVFQVAELPALP